MSTALRLQTREARKKLPKRSEPYWLEISRGRYIGYRRGATGGFWLLREHCQGMGKKGAYIKRRLGSADDDGAGDGLLSWDDARRLADGEDRPTEVTVPGRYTVGLKQRKPDLRKPEAPPGSRTSTHSLHSSLQNSVASQSLN